MKRWLTILLNLVAFDLCWTVTMFGTGRSWWWAGPLLVALSAAGQLLLHPTPRPLAPVILVGATVGVLTDLLASALGLFHFNGGLGQFALVFGALWVNFGTTLTPALRFLWRRPLAAALLGGIGGPLAYWVGHTIGAITLGESQLITLSWVALQYAILTPLWMLTADRFVPAAAPPPTSPAAPR